MRFWISLLFILVGPCSWAGQACGIYLIEDFGTMELRSLTTLYSTAGRQIHYAISNPQAPVTLNMVVGSCYCVIGLIQLDPQYRGDRDFRQITVQQILRGPYASCAHRP